MSQMSGDLWARCVPDQGRTTLTLRGPYFTLVTFGPRLARTTLASAETELAGGVGVVGVSLAAHSSFTPVPHPGPIRICSAAFDACERVRVRVKVISVSVPGLAKRFSCSEDDSGGWAACGQTAVFLYVAAGALSPSHWLATDSMLSPQQDQSVNSSGSKTPEIQLR
ncbi:hypothetical protein AOLI_G00199430 [Acnodon oligacanthus]